MKFPTTMVRLVLVALAAVSFLVGPSAGLARAAETVAHYDVKGAIDADGTLRVAATLSFGGVAPAQVVQRFATTADALNNRQYVFSIAGVTASSAGQDLKAQVTTDGGYLTVTIPTTGLTEPVVLSYEVKGAALKETNGATTLSWRLLQGLSLPVETFDAEITGPGLPILVDCKAGAPSAPGACGFFAAATREHPDPVFHDGPRGAGEVVAMTVRYPEAVVAANENIRELWTLDRAFSAKPLPLGVALGLAALGGLVFWVLHRRNGSDALAGATPLVIGEFHPVGVGETEFRITDGVRPGQVGTVLDERVDPVDVTATLLDLAIRGHLRIEELPRTSVHQPLDWALVRRESGEPLRRYEQTLLDAVAPADGRVSRVSELAAPVAAVIATVQSELYGDVVERGWFTRRPDQTRSTWTRAGWIGLALALVATFGLAALTQFGLTGLVLVALSLGVIFVAQEMPARTASGASLLNGLALLRAQLLAQRTDQMPKGRELDELSKLLPYAVVLGGAGRWLDALAAADPDETADSTDLAWYHAPNDWHLRDLPDSIRGFVTTMQGVLFSR